MLMMFKTKGSESLTVWVYLLELLVVKGHGI